MAKQKRKRLFIDADVQRTILRRIVTYAVCCYSFLILPLFIARAIETPGDQVLPEFGALLRQYGYLMVIGLVLLPLIAYDLLSLTNRMVGPVFRLRRELQRLASGKAVDPIEFRAGDYWPEMASLFNQLAEQLKQNEPRSFKSEPAESAADEECEALVAGV